MKKLVILIAVCILIVSGGTFNAEASKPIYIYIDGKVLNHFPMSFVENGTTFTPLRSVFEGLDAKVTYNGKTKTINASKGSKKIWLKLGSKQAKVNGKSVTLTAAPKVKNGTTFVPLRFISESLGEKVVWNKARAIIFIGKQPVALGSASKSLPKGAILTDSDEYSKQYTYKKTISTNVKVTEVSVHRDWATRKIKAIATIKHKNGFTNLVSISESGGGLKQVYFDGPIKLTDDEFWVIKDLIVSFESAFKIVK